MFKIWEYEEGNPRRYAKRSRSEQGTGNRELVGYHHCRGDNSVLVFGTRSSFFGLRILESILCFICGYESADHCTASSGVRQGVKRQSNGDLYPIAPDFPFHGIYTNMNVSFAHADRSQALDSVGGCSVAQSASRRTRPSEHMDVYSSPSKHLHVRLFLYIYYLALRLKYTWFSSGIARGSKTACFGFSVLV